MSPQFPRMGSGLSLEWVLEIREAQDLAGSVSSVPTLPALAACFSLRLC